MKYELVGKVELGNEIMVRTFESVDDYIRSDAHLYLNTGEEYDLYYNDKKLDLNCEDDFQVVKMHVTSQIEVIDNE